MGTKSKHVCLVENSPYFLEVAELLVSSLRDLGYKVTLSDQPDGESIILAYHLAPFSVKDHIIYQFEQLSDDEGWRCQGKLGEKIWDYSRANIEFLESKGKSPVYVPLGYHRALERIPRGDKDIDVLFYGSVNERRLDVLNEIAAAGKRVVRLFDAFGKERDDHISRSKIVLNLHYYEMSIFEQVRCHYLVNNRVCVVSESSDENPWDLPMVRYENLARVTLGLLEDPKARNALARRSYRKLKRSPMTRILERALR